MITAHLIENFHLLGDSPETVQQLRKVIIALAVTGKLAHDRQQTVAELSLRDQIHQKRKALTASGHPLRKEQPGVEAEDLPANFSDTSQFIRLGYIANVEKGMTGIQSAHPGPYPLVVTAADRATCDHYDFDGAAAIVPLVSSAGHGKASLNRLHYQDGKFALGSILAAVFPIEPDLISARFLYEYLTAFKDELLVSRMTGTANVTLTVGRLCDVPVPLIAPAIQSRIDELMELCDQLEAARNEREAQRDRLVAASLHLIGTAPAASDEVATKAQGVTLLRAAARFHLDHLPRLTTRPEHIKQLRQTILDLAVRGHLVPQDPNDEPARELLKRIQNEKEQLIKEKKIRRQQPLPPIDPGNVPFGVPSGWEWCRLGNVCHVITDGAHHTPKYEDAGIAFLSVKDVSGGVIDFRNTRYISEEAHRELCKRCKPEYGDILLTKVGTTGIAVTIDVEREFSIFVSLALLKFSKTNIDRHFLKLLINSPFVKQQSAENTQGIGNKNLVLRLINQFSIPLPPLAEQRRIVTKVDEMMTLCDQLEAQLAATQADSRFLLEAVLHEALSPIHKEVA